MQRVPRAAAPPVSRGDASHQYGRSMPKRAGKDPRGTGGHLCREVASRLPNCVTAHATPHPLWKWGSCVCPAFRVGSLRAAHMAFGQSRTTAPPAWGSRGGVDVFWAVLACSRWRFVRFAADEKSTMTLAMLSDCFAELGGTPQVVSADLLSCLKMPKDHLYTPDGGHPHVDTSANFTLRPRCGPSADAPAQGRNLSSSATHPVWPGLLPARGRSKRRRVDPVGDVGEVEPLPRPAAVDNYPCVWR